MNINADLNGLKLYKCFIKNLIHQCVYTRLGFFLSFFFLIASIPAGASRGPEKLVQIVSFSKQQDSVTMPVTLDLKTLPSPEFNIKSTNQNYHKKTYFLAQRNPWLYIQNRKSYCNEIDISLYYLPYSPLSLYSRSSGLESMAHMRPLLRLLDEDAVLDRAELQL